MTARAKTSRAASTRPFVFLNLAMTADGKIASANRKLSSVGSVRDHEHMLELRATADAVMSGARTVDLNAVNLGPGKVKFRRLRLRRGLNEYNLRIIVSGSGTINPQAEIFKRRFSPIIILTTQRAGAAKLKQLRQLADEVHVCGRTSINFEIALAWLRDKWDVKRLLCEGGGELNDALLQAHLVDELHLTICPKIFGGVKAATIADGDGFQRLADATQFKRKSFKRIGDELFLIFARTTKPASPSNNE